MTPQEFAARLRRDREIIANAAESISKDIAESVLTLIKDRSINEGISLDGVEGKKAQYSTRPTKTSKFKGKELNAAGSKYIAANIMGTWHEFRKAQGLRSEPVNLSYTNDMWKGIQVTKTTKTGDGKATSEVGSYDKEVQEKIEQNSFRYGDFLDPLPDEVQMAQEVQREKILKILRY